MMSGKARPEPSRRSRIGALILASALSLAGPAAAAGGAGAPTLPELFARLARHADATVRFSETRRLALLTRPLRLEGRLAFHPPDRLAKHVEKPTEEHYLIEGGRVTVSRPGENQRLELNLADHPPLLAFTESLRAPLAGDLAALERHWRPSLGGSWQRWLLALAPRDPELATLVRGVRLEGRDDRLVRMTLEEANGDLSILEFRP